MIVDSGSTLCNHLDARVTSPDVLQCFHEVLVVGLDVAYANSSLSRIRIFVAHLKRLIGYVFVREFHGRILIVLREGV
jgi:hypothetical protein